METVTQARLQNIETQVFPANALYIFIGAKPWTRLGRAGCY